MFTVRLLARLFNMKWEFSGEENVQKEEPAVIVCNHQSIMDLFSLGAIWPKLGLTSTVMKKELLYTGPFGLASYLCDSVYVDRSNPAKARASLDNAVHYLINKKIKIWMFPEGTLNKTGTLLPFKKGAFHMAIQAQVPLLPIVISPYSSFYDSSKRKFENGGKLNVMILPPVPTTGLTVSNMDDLIESVTKMMQNAYDSMVGISTENKVNGVATPHPTSDSADIRT